MARGVRRSGCLDRPTGHLQRGVREGAGSRTGRRPRRRAARTHPHPVRDARPTRPLPPPDRGGDRALVPGLLGARRGERPGQRADPGRPRRWSLGRHRTEGLDVPRPAGRLVLRGLPDRPGFVAPPRALVPPRPDGPAGGRDPPDHPADPDLGVQRGVLRRRPHAGRPRGGPAGRRVEGGPGHPGLRAGGRPPRAPAHLPARARPAGGDRARVGGARPTRSSASGWPAPTSSWRSCASTRCGASRGTTVRSPLPRPRSSSSTGPAGTSASGSWPWTSADPAGLVLEAPPYELDDVQRSFLFSRSETIYGGSDRDPAQHHRRTGPRPAARAEGGPLDDRVGGPDGRPAGRARAAHRQGGGGDRGGGYRDRLRHRQAVRRGGGDRGGLRHPPAPPRRGGRLARRDARARRHPTAGGPLQRDRRGAGPTPLRRGRRRARPVRRGGQQRRDWAVRSRSSR